MKLPSRRQIANIKNSCELNGGCDVKVIEDGCSKKRGNIPTVSKDRICGGGKQHLDDRRVGGLNYKPMQPLN